MAGTRYITREEFERRPWLLDDADPLTLLLFAQHGAISSEQARRQLSRSAIRHRLRTGDFVRAHPRVYTVVGAPATDEQRSWVAVLAVEGAVLAGRTALTALGLVGFRTPTTHVLVPAQRRTRSAPPFVIVHRTTVLGTDDLLKRSPSVTTVGRAVVDAAAWARTDREASAIIAMAFQQRLATLPEVETVLARMTRVPRRQLIGRVSTLAAGGAGSLGELDFIALMARAGLPRPTLQPARLDRDGRRRYLDALFEEWGVRVEVEGAHHLDVRQAWADAQRQNALWIAGERVLRFPAWAVVAEPDAVIADVRAALIQAGWRPT